MAYREIETKELAKDVLPSHGPSFFRPSNPKPNIHHPHSFHPSDPPLKPEPPMAEPQPPSTHEGADLEDPEPPSIPKSAEDRKAAAALSSLDARNDDDSTSTNKQQVDQEALGKAMKNLEIAGSAKKGTGKTVKKEEKKTVKVDQADVALLVDELDLTKAKATNLLQAHDGDAVRAMKAFVTASA
ncbi:MAG: hypothetical protein M1836_003498 [Candelina mexicana]|nr:MAG: hypothetical protein M1836_003498 [Candelina mexicana]